VPGDRAVDAQGAFGARVTYPAAASDVVDGTVPVSCSPDSGAVFPLGATMVACQTVDRAGNQGFAYFEVTVIDRSPAALHLENMTVYADDTMGARLTYAPAPSATDITGRPVSIECVPPSGTLLPIGDTLVACTAAAGTLNEARGSFTVTVLDPPPTVTVPGDIVAEATSPAGAAVTLPVTATDAQERPLLPLCTPASGATFPFGVTTVTCQATDDRGAITTSGPFTVTVHDTTAPRLTVPPDITITSCRAPNIGGPSATDAASSPVTLTSDKPTTFPLGITVVTHTARDARGNATTGTQRVTAALGDDPSCCPARMRIIRGTSNNDRLTGTGGRDCILGLGGHDQIHGGGGNDVISGGDGDDVIQGGSGNDQIFGGAGHNICIGGTGTDDLKQCGGPERPSDHL
jgi:hypothetical protein